MICCTTIDGWLWRWTLSREPDLTVRGDDDSIYLVQHHVWRKNGLLNLYYHEIRRSDEGRDLHDHRAFNVSLVLTQGYWEHLSDGRRLWRRPGQLIFRRASTPHRIELAKAPTGQDVIATTLWLKLPDTRPWGFWRQGAWLPARQYEAEQGRDL